MVISSGMIAGLRPKITVLTESDGYGTSTQLTSTDYCVVVSDQSRKRYITLPQFPGLGQRIEIIKRWDAQIEVDSGTLPVYCATSTGNGNNGTVGINTTKVGKGSNVMLTYIFLGDI